MNLVLSPLSLLLRRLPFEAVRWRLIPYALQQCQRAHQLPTYRTIRCRAGFRMRINLGDWLGRHLYVTGEYEPATSRLFQRILKRGATFLDIGANAGYFTCLAARQVGDTGRVISFEPLEDIRGQLLRNIELNRFPHCQVFDVALSNTNGTSEFFGGPSDHSGVSSLRPLEGSARRLQITTARLDDFLDAETQVDCVKIDVEGAECHVLEGMQQTLARCRPDLVVEMTSEYLGALGRSPADIHNLLSPLGYQAYRIADSGLEPISFSDPPSESPTQYNAYFTVSAPSSKS